MAGCAENEETGGDGENEMLVLHIVLHLST